jgi:hypothetical protein
MWLCTYLEACIRSLDDHESVQVSLRDTTRYGLFACFDRVYLQIGVYAILVNKCLSPSTHMLLLALVRARSHASKHVCFQYCEIASALIPSLRWACATTLLRRLKGKATDNVPMKWLMFNVAVPRFRGSCSLMSLCSCGQSRVCAFLPAPKSSWKRSCV